MWPYKLILLVRFHSAIFLWNFVLVLCELLKHSYTLQEIYNSIIGVKRRKSFLVVY